MDPGAPSYRAAFFLSPHHLGLGLLTLGVGVASFHPVPLAAGIASYALGWLCLPKLPFFRQWADRRSRNTRSGSDRARVDDFVLRRDGLLQALTPARQQRYLALTEVCRDIESASSDHPLAPAIGPADIRLRKLDELMWTYLRLLTIEESLQRFLETEQREEIPALIGQAESELRALRLDLEALEQREDLRAVEAKRRLVTSRQERLESLRRRADRLAQARENLVLVVAEQERLEQQIKLVRADAVATKNASALTARIDATVEHLNHTNRWLAEMDDFKDLLIDLPQTELRLGFSPRASEPRTLSRLPSG